MSAHAIGSPPASMQPVVFDKGLARAAATALRSAARAVAQASADRSSAASTAGADWTGPQRLRFDATEKAASGHAVSAAGELRDQAQRLDDQVDKVEAEDRKRARQRAEWRDEQRAKAEKAERAEKAPFGGNRP